MKCCSEYPLSHSVSLLRSLLNHNNLGLSVAASESLLKLAKTKKINKEFEVPFINDIKNFSKRYFRLHCILLLLSNEKRAMLVRDQLISEQKKLVHIILKLVSLQIPDSPVDSHIKHIINNSDKDLPYILEFFDTSFEKEIRNILMPIVDPEIDYKQEDINLEQRANSIDQYIMTV